MRTGAASPADTAPGPWSSAPPRAWARPSPGGGAEQGINVVLLARRQAVLDEVAARSGPRPTSRRARVAVDLAETDAMATIAAATQDLEVGLVMYCAGADPNYRPFLAEPVESALAMVQRNCVGADAGVPPLRRADGGTGSGRHRAALVRRRLRRRAQHGRLRRHEGVRHRDGRGPVGRAAPPGRRRARAGARHDRHAGAAAAVGAAGAAGRPRRPRADPRRGVGRGGGRPCHRQPGRRPDLSTPETTSRWAPSTSRRHVAQRRGAADDRSRWRGDGRRSGGGSDR